MTINKKEWKQLYEAADAMNNALSDYRNGKEKNKDITEAIKYAKSRLRLLMNKARVQ